MVNPFWAYAFLYVALLFYCLWRKPSPEPIAPWPKLESVVRQRRNGVFYPVVECQNDEDCGETDGGVMCFQGECVQKLSSSATCNPVTGTWTLVDDGYGNRFLQCMCKYPHLITQKNPSSDCVVDIACGPHGQLADWSKRDACTCDEGYESVPGGKLMCRKQFAYERKNEPCHSDDESEQVPNSYSTAYKKEYQDVHCHKRPCTFDVVDGRPLTDTHYDPTFGCVCNPKQGHFGVRFDNVEDGQVLESGYYQGCSSIFSRDPEKPLDNTRIYSYFYALDKDPIAFYEWPDVDASNPLLRPHFREILLREQKKKKQNEDDDDEEEEGRSKSSLMVGQHWEHHYGQYVLQYLNYDVRIKELVRTYLGSFNEYDKLIWRWHPPVDCRSMADMFGNDNHKFKKPTAYAMLFDYPVCRVGEDANRDPERYRGKYVMNPYHAVWRHGWNSDRSNGFYLRWGEEHQRWILDLAPPFRRDELLDEADTGLLPSGLNDHPKLQNLTFRT